MKPKIFVFINSGAGTDWVCGMAIAEDGHVLASHVSSCYSWFLQDMGLHSNSKRKHELYEAHYPEGYELVEVPVNECRQHPGLQEAIRLNGLLPAND